MSLTKYDEKQRHLLNTIIEPTGKTIDELAAQAVRYCYIHAESVEVLQADPTKLQNMEAALRDPRTRPQNLIPVDDTGDSLSLSNIMFNGINGEEAVATLGAYDEYLKRVPSSFEDHFWFTRFAASGMMILEQHVVMPQVCEIPGAFDLYNKHKSEFIDTMPADHSLAQGSAATSSTASSANCNPLPITREEAEIIADDFAALSTRQFNVPEDYLDEGGFQSWKVVGINFRPLMYEVLFLNIDTPIPYTRDDLIDLLTESSK
ncbi:hypothetical protein EVG20_g4245 [Dentipellis fragilis]|uniref:Uncharacterized protein n=1 Tax=Dentipellis fragilis TaxID=205917 RepID=A0A4Y9Z0E2_9AGAM|nr:hypothetical protein EVG20_g4245 [Dentipellis fragilis]